MPLSPGYQEHLEPALDVRRVDALWSFAATGAGEHRVLPDGRMDFIVQFRLHEDGRVTDVASLVAGPSSRFFVVPVEPGDSFFGVRFRAGWGGAAVGLVPSDLRDQVLNGASVGAHFGARLAAILAATDVASLRNRFVAFSRQLVDRSRLHAPADAVQAAIDMLHVSGGSLTSAELARLTGCNERTLRRGIGDAVGLPVKQLAMVLRFQRTLRLLVQSGARALTLAEAALEGGYADQAHMAREFRRLGGFTPAAKPAVVLGSINPQPGQFLQDQGLADRYDRP